MVMYLHRFTNTKTGDFIDMFVQEYGGFLRTQMRTMVLVYLPT